ncbi:MAG TPA: peptidyl-prolyl cis-trans isomerase [Polyangia bacterium]|nr:peptidyl-prolyl cis-trans isomerase [Polyangia bacterium]
MTASRTQRASLLMISACVLLGAVALFTTGAKTPEESADDHDKVHGAAPAPAAAAPVSAEEQARLALPVAEVAGVRITIGDFESALAKQSPLMRKELEDLGKRKEFLDKLLNMEALAAEAVRRGYDKDPEAVSVLRNQLASLMHRRIADGIPEAQPTDEALRAYYDSNIESYRKPAKVRARHILVSDEAKARQLLDNVKGTKPSQYEFRRLAQENSEDEATRLRGGDLTFFPMPGEHRGDDPEVPAPLAEAAFKIKENGDLFPDLVKSDKGFHIIMRTGYRDKMDLGFEETRDRLVMLVQREQRKDSVEKAIDNLQQRFKIELQEENLKDVVIDLTGGPPAPGAPGGLTPDEKKNVEKARKAQREGLDLQSGKTKQE